MATHLIPVFTGESTQLCNARDLHSALQVETRFNDWIDRRIEEYGFIDGEDFYSSLSKTPKRSKGGRPTIDYQLTIDMAKELAMIENNEVGRQVRRYFIRVEDELRAELRDKARHVLELPGVKSLRSGITFKQTLILQRQSRTLMGLIINEPSPAARLNLHRQLRQVNDALGIPTDPLEEISGASLLIEGV